MEITIKYKMATFVVDITKKAIVCLNEYHITEIIQFGNAIAEKRSEHHVHSTFRDMNTLIVSLKLTIVIMYIYVDIQCGYKKNSHKN